MKKISKLLIALLTISGAMLATNALAYQANSGAGTTSQTSVQYQRQQQEQARQAEIARQQQMRQQQQRQEQARLQAELQAKRDAIARQQQRDAATARFVESRTFKTLEKIDPYGRVISRSLIGCGAAGAAGTVGGPVGAGVACVSGAILAN